MASGHVNRAKGRTHGCTDQACKREESTCQLGAVHTWHLADMTTDFREVRFKADIRKCSGNVR